MQEVIFLIHLTSGGISSGMLTWLAEDVCILSREIPLTYTFTQLQNK